MAYGYEGLSAQEFSDIHESVMEAMAYVALPVTFYRVSATQPLDHLYGEAEGGREQWVALPVMFASVFQKPTDEMLTRQGLFTGADLLLFIPRQHVLNWEAETGAAFVVTEDMEVAYQQVRYNIKQVRTDYLPVGDGVAQDYIGMVVTATIKPK